MSELIQAVLVLGPRHLMKLREGYRAGWVSMLRGYVTTKTMHALLGIGLLAELRDKGTVNLVSFAEAQNLDLAILRSACETMYSVGIFDREGDTYRLDDDGQILIDVFHGWLEMSYGYAVLFDNLEPMLRKDKAYGKDFYRLSDYVGRGSGELENGLFFPLANDIVLRKGYKRVLDLGCGDGTFLRKLCEMNSEVACYGIDIAHLAIEDGHRTTAKSGLSNRVKLHAADVQDINAIPEDFKNIDAATIFFVLHEILWLGEKNLIDFLKGFRRNFPDVPLIAFEAIRPTAEEMRKNPGIAIYYYFYHDLSHQKPIGRDEWKRLFQAAGFESIEERYLPFARTAIYTLQ